MRGTFTKPAAAGQEAATPDQLAVIAMGRSNLSPCRLIRGASVLHAGQIGPLDRSAFGRTKAGHSRSDELQ